MRPESGPDAEGPDHEAHALDQPEHAEHERNRFDPAARALVHGPGRTMWTSPDDYPERVGDAVSAKASARRRGGG